jgi:hypothetical protein
VDEGGQLVPQGEILDHQVSAGEEGRSHGGEQQQTEAEHEATQNPSSLGNVKESGSDLVLATDTMADSADRATVWLTAFRSSFGQGQLPDGVEGPRQGEVEAQDGAERHDQARERADRG